MHTAYLQLTQYVRRCMNIEYFTGALSGEEEYRLSYKYLIKISLSRCSDIAPTSVTILYLLVLVLHVLYGCHSVCM